MGCFRLYERKVLFESCKYFTFKGYVRTGFEHFALPTDDVAKAANKTALYNSLGSTSGDVENIITVGRSAYSTIGKYYFQALMSKKIFSIPPERRSAIFRGYQLSEDDFIRRDIIKSIRTYFEYDFSKLDNFSSDVEAFSEEFNLLREFEDDGLIEINGKWITLTENGKHFLTLLARFSIST